MEAEAETRKHIQLVAKFLHIFSCELLKRATLHDQSKLEEPEASILSKYTPFLRTCTYGSEEYKQILSSPEMKAALNHHYAHNKHHPEFNDVNGFSFQTLNDPIRSMDLIDFVEMVCDWLASTRRHDTGNIGKSITINAERFHLDEQITALLRNTTALLEDFEKRDYPAKSGD
jgi:hypothetical protein